jgi:hypothetical protein
LAPGALWKNWSEGVTARFHEGEFAVSRPSDFVFRPNSDVSIDSRAALAPMDEEELLN